MNNKGKTLKLIVIVAVTLGLCLISNSSKAFTLTLTPQPEKNAIQLDWDSPEGNLYKIWQLKPGDYEYQSISTASLDTYLETVQVLNLYPTNVPESRWPIEETVTFTTYDGETLTLPKSANVKQWMEEPNSEDPKGYGRGLIEVTPVSLEDFSDNPSKYLKDSKGNYKYDIIYIGHWDGNGQNYITESTVSAIEQFIDDGFGCLIRT